MKCRIFRLSSSLEAFALPEPPAKIMEKAYIYLVDPVVSYIFPCKASGDSYVRSKIFGPFCVDIAPGFKVLHLGL